MSLGLQTPAAAAIGAAAAAATAAAAVAAPGRTCSRRIAVNMWQPSGFVHKVDIAAATAAAAPHHRLRTAAQSGTGSTNLGLHHLHLPLLLVDF
jgi:hypothetical protein